MKKNERVKYFDISLTILNFIVMIVIAILVFSNVVLTILSFISTAFLFGLTLVSFSRKNPYYISSSCGMAICGLVFSIGLYMTPERALYSFFAISFSVTIILDVYFIASLMKLSGSSYKGMSRLNFLGSVIDPNPDASKYLKDRYGPLENDKGNKAAELERIREIRKKYHSWRIMLITLISTLMFFSTTILSLL